MGHVIWNQAETRKPSRRSGRSLPEEKRKPPRFSWKWLMVFVGGLFAIVFFGQRPFIVYDEYGQPSLAPWRKDKMWREIDEVESSEQYVLIATIDNYFPCFNCPDGQLIFLRKGEVWKYGVTRKGQTGRYSNEWLGSNSLSYKIQFIGNIEECLKEEKRKIYFYPLLPENFQRRVPLIRPPGNKNDN